MPSAQLQKLIRHIGELCRDLLPDPFIDTGIYPNPAVVNTRTVAFVALVHAEFEAYFEDRAIEVAMAARDAFLTSAHVSRPIVCLLGFDPTSSQAPGDKLAAGGQEAKELEKWINSTDIKARVKAAGDSFLTFARVGNNGIKEKDLAALLLPIGFRYFGFDALLVRALDNLGSSRGSFVHRGKDRHVIANLDPKTQHHELSKLANDLQKIDEEFDTLLAECRTAASRANAVHRVPTGAWPPI